MLFLVFGFLFPLVIAVLFFLQRLYQEMSVHAIASYQNVNQQMLQTLGSVLDSVNKYTTYPYYNSDFQSFLHRDYRTERGQLDITTDTRLYKRYVHEQILRYNSKIGTAVLVNVTSGTRFVGGYYPDEDVMRALDRTMSRLQDANAADGTTVTFQGLDRYRATYIASARPIFDPADRRYLGYFCLIINAQELNETFRHQRQNGVRRYILDQNMKIVYDSGGERIGLTADGPLAAFAAMETDYKQQMLDGQHMALLKSVSEPTGWRVVTFVNSDLLFEDVRIRQQNLTLTLMAMLLAAIGAAIWFAISISRPINRLRHVIASNVEKRFRTLVPVTSNDEVGDLAHSFNQMQEEMKQLLSQVVAQERAKRTAEIHALQAQINPHFLYNTLNTIKWMANMQCADNIGEATASLIYMLRYASSMQGDLVSIRDELQFVEKYLSLMQLRYCDRFDVKFDIEEEALDGLSLRFLLQPFVENAIFHGFQGNEAANLLTIGARVDRQDLILTVEDNGVGMTDRQLEHIQADDLHREGFNSIGIRNVMERIKLHYDDRYGVVLSSGPMRGTRVVITLPMETNKAGR